MQQNFEQIEQKIGYVFKNKELLNTAFLHSSFANSHHEKSNERLEFLGDSILNFVTTEFLYNNFENSEGDLSKQKAYLVSAENLSQAINQMNLLKFLQCSNFNPNKSKNVACDLFEAIVGAIFLDSDLLTAKNFIINTLKYDKKNVENQFENVVDYKTNLQEIVQKSGENTIEYVLIDKQGQDHNPSFTVRLTIDGNTIVEQTAKTKKMAEILCAKYACEILSK